MGRLFWIVWVGWCDRQSLHKKETGGQRESERCYAIEDGGRDHTPGNVGSLWKLERVGEPIFP